MFPVLVDVVTVLRSPRGELPVQVMIYALKAIASLASGNTANRAHLAELGACEGL